MKNESHHPLPLLHAIGENLYRGMHYESSSHPLSSLASRTLVFVFPHFPMFSVDFEGFSITVTDNVVVQMSLFSRISGNYWVSSRECNKKGTEKDML